MGKIFSIVVLVSFFLVGCGGDKTTNNYYGAEVPKISSSVASSSVSLSSSSSSSSAAATEAPTLWAYNSDYSNDRNGFITNTRYIPSTVHDQKINTLILWSTFKSGYISEIEISDESISDESQVSIYTEMGKLGVVAQKKSPGVYILPINQNIKQEESLQIDLLTSIRLGTVNSSHKFTVTSITINGEKKEFNLHLQTLVLTSFVVPEPYNSIELSAPSNSSSVSAKLKIYPDYWSDFKVKQIKAQITQMPNTNPILMDQYVACLRPVGSTDSCAGYSTSIPVSALADGKTFVFYPEEVTDINSVIGYNFGIVEYEIYVDSPYMLRGNGRNWSISIHEITYEYIPTEYYIPVEYNFGINLW